MSEFATRLKAIRLKKDLSMRNAAKLIGVPESTYREWEYGRAIRGEPYPKIADSYGISLEELFGIDKKQTSLAEDFEYLEYLVRSMKAKTPK